MRYRRTVATSGNAMHRDRTQEVGGSSPPSSIYKTPAKTGSSVSVQPGRRSGECGDWVAAGVGGEGLGEVGEERLVAEPAGDRGGEESFDGAFAVFGLAAERELAVDDGAAEAAFGVVVGRFDAVGVGEGPEGGPALEEVAREVAVVLGARAFAGGVLEQRSEA